MPKFCCRSALSNFAHAELPVALILAANPLPSEAADEARLCGPLPVRRLKAEEAPGTADGDPTIADRYKRCVPAIAEKRSEDQLSSAASKRFQAGRRSPEFRDLPLSPVCAPCNRRAEPYSRPALSLGGLCSFRLDRGRIFAAPNPDRLDSEPT